MTTDQRAIYNFVRSKGEATKAEIFAFTGDPYYCNGEKYIGDRLSRMVNAGFLIRVKKGVYKCGIGKKSRPVAAIENQLNLFK